MKNNAINEEKSPEIIKSQAPSMWTKEEEQYLRESWGYISVEAIAKKMNRSLNSIKSKATKMKLGASIENNLNYLIEVDGGINDKTASLVNKADILVSGSYITDSNDYLDKINKLRSIFMNRGFTLAELMAVIVIIGIIAVITTMTVDRSIKNSRYDTCLAQEKNIIEGAKMWSYDNAGELEKLDKKEITNITISIPKLQNGNYIEDGLKSPMTNEVYSTDTNVTITSSNGTSYDYEVIYGKEEEICSK